MGKEIDTFTQCQLIKERTQYTAWIPTKFAIRGKFVKVKRDGKWDDGWEVLVAGKTLPAEAILDRERDHKKWRDTTDI